LKTRERIRTAEALVISHKEFGEADRLLLLFSRELGKIRAIAKGVRRSRSRKAGHLQPITCVTLVLAKGKNFWIITQADAVEDYKNIKADLNLIGYASYVLELAGNLTAEEEADLHVYTLLKQALGFISLGFDPFNIVRFIELHFLESSGYRPELVHCVQCRKEIIPETQFLSASHGGVLCPQCGKMIAEKKTISMTALKFIRFFQRGDLQTAIRARIKLDVRNEVQSIMDYFLSYVLDRNMNSLKFLNQLKRLDVQ